MPLQDQITCVQRLDTEDSHHCHRRLGRYHGVYTIQAAIGSVGKVQGKIHQPSLLNTVNQAYTGHLILVEGKNHKAYIKIS